MSDTVTFAPHRAAAPPPRRGPAGWLDRIFPVDDAISVGDLALLPLIVCNLVTTVGLAGDISRHLMHPEQLAKGNDFLSGWHLVLYGGVASVGLWLGIGAVVRGPGFIRAAPATAIGFALLSAGGVVDAIWHSVFGTEAMVEALVSPPHLVVFAGLVFLLSSPIAILWRRPVQRLGLVPSIAAVLSIVSVVLVTSLFTGFLSPLAGGLSLQGYVEPLVGESLQDYDQVRGLGIAIWTVAVIVAATSVVLVRFRPIRGSMVASFLLIGVPALVVTQQQKATTPVITTYATDGTPITTGNVWPLVFGFVAAGLGSEIVVALFARPVLRRVGIALNGAVIGGGLWGATFFFLRQDHRLNWSPALGGGAVTLSTLVGATVASLVALPVPDPTRPSGPTPTSGVPAVHGRGVGSPF